MRCFLLRVAATAAAMAGCGSEVTIEPAEDTGDAPPPSVEQPPAAPDDDPDPPDDDPGSLACSQSVAEIGFDLVQMPAGCLDTASSPLTLDLTAVSAVPSSDGIRLDFEKCGGASGCACALTLDGVGADLADVLALEHTVSLYGAIAPSSIELYMYPPCFFCVGCPCPNPLPLIAAYDGPLAAQWVGLEKTLTVEQRAVTCADVDGGCETVAYDLRAEAFLIDPSGGIVSGPLGELVVGETGSGMIGESVLTFRVIRASGRSEACDGPTLPIGEGAWVAATVFP
jgi:hypothetical protein